MPIRRLDPATVAGISAGEVIERPASIVKELVENALDAGATRITVELERGGLGLIRVTDDGCGIPSGEALLAFDRHATSKLAVLDDLGTLATYGFRGEALAAIAAAGEVELLTRPGGVTDGVRVAGGGGVALTVGPAGCPAGTSLAVRRLFAAMPARLKFLRSPQAEAAAAARVVEACVLTRPGVHLVLRVDGEERLNAPRAADAAGRLRAILGASASTLIPFDRGEAGWRAHGLAEPPGAVRRRGRQWVIVNGRPVEDRALRHALLSAYAGQLPRDTQPHAVVYLDVPPAQVDVNVHPAKAEVRFADPSTAYRTVLRAVRDGFASAGVAPRAAAAAAGESPAGAETGTGPVPAGALPAAEPAWNWETPSGSGGVEVLGQLFRTYIVARLPDGLVLVDQHTAHEKILYEEMATQAAAAVTQPLLLPHTIELAPSEVLRLSGQEPALRALGFDLEPFGGNAIVVRAIPAGARDRDIGPLLRWLVEDLEQAGRATAPGELNHKLRATVACHLAAKAGDHLERAEMEGIVRGLLALADPASCPHGRPTFVKYDEGDLARQFRRTWGLGKRECH